MLQSKKMEHFVKFQTWWQKSLYINIPFSIQESFVASLDLMQRSHKIHLASLQREALILEMAYTYSFWGSSLFCPLAKSWFAQSWSADVGVPGEVLTTWLDILSQFLDMDVPSLDTGNDVMFWEEFLRRLVCSQDQERLPFGLACINVETLKDIRGCWENPEHASCAHIFRSAPNNLGAQGQSPTVKDLAKVSLHIKKQIQNDPLSPLVWRTSAVVTFGQNINGQNTHILHFNKKSMEDIHKNAKKITGFLSLFLPYQTAQRQQLFPAPPLSLDKILTVLKSQSTRHHLNTEFLFSWMDTNWESLKTNLEDLVKTCKDLGFVTPIGTSGKKESYVLSKQALNVLNPYAEVLAHSLVL